MSFDQATVSLNIQSSRDQLAVLRSITRTITARYALTVNDVTDLVLAVDEAAATLLGHSIRSVPVDCSFHFTQGHRLHVAVSVTTPARIDISKATFGWIVMQTLTSDLGLDQSQDTCTRLWTARIALRKDLQVDP